MVCAYCNKPITDIRYKTLRKKSYHNECYQLQLGLIEAENRKKAINFTKLKSSKGNNEDEEQINQLKKYICDLFQIDKVPFLIEKQIVEYTTNYNYTYNGIYKTLVYFYDLSNNPVPPQVTIGIVPYVYEEAKNFYYNAYQVNIVNSKTHIENNTKQVKIQPPDTSLGGCVDISKL